MRIARLLKKNIALICVVALIASCDDGDALKTETPTEAGTSPTLEQVSVPLQTGDAGSRKILLDQIQSLKSAIRPLDKISYKREYYRHHAWEWSYRARAALLAYRIYGDIEQVRAVLEGALYYAGLPHWKTWKRSTDSWFSEITTPGLISIPIADLLLLSRQDELVHVLVIEHYEILLNAIIRGVSGFDSSYRRIGDTGYYITPLNESKVEALNHMAIYTVALARIYELTGDETYRTRVGQIARYWLASTTRHANGALSWPYAPIPDNMHSVAEPFWKGSVTIELPISAHRIGASITDEQLLQVQKTLILNIFENGQWGGRTYLVNGQREKKEIKPSQVKQMPVLAMWHLLDCVAPPVDNLDLELFKTNQRFYEKTSRALYGAVFGLFARSGHCD